MNQIIFNYDYNYKKKSVLENKKNIYLSLFIITIIIIIFILFYIIYAKYKIYKENQISELIKYNYNIGTLYSNSKGSSNYNAIQLSNTISIIGLIEIPKINLSYPILSQTNEELLKISVCRFSRSSSTSQW